MSDRRPTIQELAKASGTTLSEMGVTEIEGQEINKRIFELEATDWAKIVNNEFKSNIKSMMPNESGSLARSVKNKNLMNKEDLIENVSFEFYRSGIFQAYGVGKGYIHTEMGVVRGHKTKNSKAKHSKNTTAFVPSNFLSKGIKRKPVDWFDTVVESKIGGLADLVTEYFGDKYVLAAAAGTRIIKK